MRVFRIFPVVIVVAATLAAQTPALAGSPSEALLLLRQVSRKYAEAQSYHIEAVEEQTSNNDLRREWRKTAMSAAIAAGGRYRFEGQSAFGSAVIVSDGKTVWSYHLHEHLYTEAAASHELSGPRRLEPEEEAARRAEHLRQFLSHIADNLKAATMRPEETITVNDRPVHCVVLSYNEQDLKEKPPDEREEVTIWIDQQRGVIVRTLSRGQTYLVLPGSEMHVPFFKETSTVYRLVTLEPHDALETFVFIPPADAKLVDEFPETKAFSRQRQAAGLPEPVASETWLGKPAPEFRLTSSEGKTVSPGSFRGKPVLIDVWSTSCAPCRAMIPDLKKLYEEVAAKGLVFLTVDHNDDPRVATEVLAHERVSWTNYHDPEDAVQRAFKSIGVPFQVLIDEEGKVRFSQVGDDMPKLREAIANLGPRYRSVASARGPGERQ